MASTIINKTAKELSNIIREDIKNKTSPYDTPAEVIRVDGDIVWVHIPGGVSETPVKKTVNASPGDIIQVRVSGGKAWIVGNASSPPTDDTLAIQAYEAAAVAKEASVNARTYADEAYSAASAAQTAADSAQADADAALQQVTVATQAATDAQTAADAASSSAATAASSASSAATAATTAATAADAASSSAASSASSASSARSDATEAKASAENASEYASRALGNLSTVQSVAETLAWITEHGTMTNTQQLQPPETDLDPTHVYFVLDDPPTGQTEPHGDYHVDGHYYAIVTEPVLSDIASYYVLTIDESLNNYVGSHLVLDSEGLWVIADENTQRNKVLISLGATGSSYGSGLHIFDGSLSTAEFGPNGSRIGLNTGYTSYMLLDNYSFKMNDRNGNEYVHFSDLRTTEMQIGPRAYVGQYDDYDFVSGSSAIVTYLPYYFNNDFHLTKILVYITLNDSEYEYIEIPLENCSILPEEENSRTRIDISIASPISDIDHIHIEFYSTSPLCKAYTLGIRGNSFGNRVIGILSFVEGYQNNASGQYSHAEGTKNNSSGLASHSEGYYTVASGESAHSEGNGTTASGRHSHAEGYSTVANGRRTHAEGAYTKAIGDYSHAEGYYAEAKNLSAHAEGYYAIAESAYSHAEGYYTVASGQYAHAEGRGSSSDSYDFAASGDASHREGAYTKAIGDYSHAEGYDTEASDESAHSEGDGTTASGKYSHAEGYHTEAKNLSAHAEGRETISGGIYSHAGGYKTNANKFCQTVIGAYNEIDTYGGSPPNSNAKGKYIFIAGNGETEETRSNALTVDWRGRIEAGDYSGNFKSIFDIFYPVGSYYKTSLNASIPSGSQTPTTADMATLGVTWFNPKYAWGGTWALLTTSNEQTNTVGTTLSKAFRASAANTWQYTNLSFTVPKGHRYMVSVELGWTAGKPIGVGFHTSSTTLGNWGAPRFNSENSDGLSRFTAYLYNGTYYLWEKRAGVPTADNTNYIYITDIDYSTNTQIWHRTE